MRLILLVAALVCFILATVGAGGRWNLVAAGLACQAAATLVF